LKKDTETEDVASDGEDVREQMCRVSGSILQMTLNYLSASVIARVGLRHFIHIVVEFGMNTCGDTSSIIVNLVLEYFSKQLPLASVLPQLHFPRLSAYNPFPFLLLFNFPSTTALVLKDNSLSHSS
jgi:hypothetical protein